MYSLHDVKITGISLDRILSCEIKSQTGEHSTLTLGGYASACMQVCRRTRHPL